MPNRRDAATRKIFPGVVRRAVHDFNQPLQALRMMIELPGVVADDGRAIPRKLGLALAELEARFAQIQALARVLDGAAEDEPPRMIPFSDVVAMARRLRPELWSGDVRVVAVHAACPVCLPLRAAGWCLNALVANARAARPRSRIVVGPREGGRRIIVADDGDGMNRVRLAQLRKALVGGDAAILGAGLALASALVARWGGVWRVDAVDGGGSCVGFSTASGAA
jgi:C4-dicarboxylate-specific signal transduction histidine kinase